MNTTISMKLIPFDILWRIGLENICFATITTLGRDVFKFWKLKLSNTMCYVLPKNQIFIESIDLSQIIIGVIDFNSLDSSQLLRVQ